MPTKTKTKKEIYWRCKKCGDEIYWNTHKSMTYCKCGALGVDGCEFCLRLIGDEADREEIKKVREKPIRHPACPERSRRSGVLRGNGV